MRCRSDMVTVLATLGWVALGGCQTPVDLGDQFGSGTDSAADAGSTVGVDGTADGDGGGADGGTGGKADTGGPLYDVGNADDGGGSGDCFACSVDGHQVLGCNGEVLETCEDVEACDVVTEGCNDACTAMVHNKSSIGCEYWSTKLDFGKGDGNVSNNNSCMAAFVANTWTIPVHISVEYAGIEKNVESFARIPVGNGANLQLLPYDAAAGLGPDEVAILFLSGPECPTTPAVSEALVVGTGRGESFNIRTDLPVVVYQQNPYSSVDGGASSGGSLLLPTSAWDSNYIGAMASIGMESEGGAAPSLNVMATEDDTEVTIMPMADIAGGGGVSPTPAGVPLVEVLDRGEHLQIVQDADLTGSVIQSSAPVGVIGGHAGLGIDGGFLDRAEEMLPPVRAMGWEYVGVMHEPRGTETGWWRMVGAVDGTQLDWTPGVGGPQTLDQGETVVFSTDEAFVVSSQDEDHPFLLFNYMSGTTSEGVGNDSTGDPEMVTMVPPRQYLSHYVFFMLPSFPEGNLVLVRARENGVFHPVQLDCLGEVTGWTPVGDYEWTRVQTITGDFQDVGSCSSGRHTLSSDGPVGLFIWGWGNETQISGRGRTSYAYPGGMNVRPINDVVIPPEG